MFFLFLNILFTKINLFSEIKLFKKLTFSLRRPDLKGREGAGLGQRKGKEKDFKGMEAGPKGWDGEGESSRWSDAGGRSLKFVWSSPPTTGQAGMSLAKKGQTGIEGNRVTGAPYLR